MEALGLRHRPKCIAHNLTREDCAVQKSDGLLKRDFSHSKALEKAEKILACFVSTVIDNFKVCPHKRKEEVPCH